MCATANSMTDEEKIIIDVVKTAPARTNGGFFIKKKLNYLQPFGYRYPYPAPRTKSENKDVVSIPFSVRT